MTDADGRRLDASLRRIESLIAALDDLPDPDAREPARELLDQVLDLHALALARMTAMIAAAEGGPALLARLAADDQVRAVLLLHGLHPETVEARIRDAVERLRPGLGARGIRVELVKAGAAAARLRVHMDDRVGALGADEIRQEIEDAVVGAAPEIEELVIEGLGDADAANLPALAG
jgi:hypothetical protein